MTQSPSPPPPPEPDEQPPVGGHGDYPVQVTFERPGEQSRLLALGSIPAFLVRAILLIPHYIALNVVYVVVVFTVWFGFWAVLFTGRNPDALFDFSSGVLRWQTRAYAYLFGLTDRYPPFGFRP